MKNIKYYRLPELPYDLNALEPFISKMQLETHYDKHHKKYVDNANKLLDKLDHSPGELSDEQVKSIWKELSFNAGGIILHDLYWENLHKQGDQSPDPKLIEAIDANYGNPEKFKEIFSKTAEKIEGSGWAALSYDAETGRLLITSIGNHNLNLYPTSKILLVLDVWEHAYYIDYQSDRKQYIENFWKIVDWKVVGERLKAVSD